MAEAGWSESAKKRVWAGRTLLAGNACAEVAPPVGVARRTRAYGSGSLMTAASMPSEARPSGGVRLSLVHAADSGTRTRKTLGATTYSKTV